MIEIIEFFRQSEMAFFMSYIALITSVSAISWLSLGKSFTTRRAWIVGCMLTFLVASYLSVGELLGRPKPIGVLTDVMPHVKEATIHGAKLEPDVAIYLMLTWSGASSPRLIDFAWDAKLAKQIQAGLKGVSKGKFKKLIIRKPFMFSLDNRPPVIHPVPWPKPPEKTVAPPTYQNLNRIQRQQQDISPRPSRGPH
jgi:hypothetical protein